MTRAIGLAIAIIYVRMSAAVDLGSAASSGDARCCCVCCDDYSLKPQPCVPCAPIGRCNDYCPKPMPCTAPLRYCGPNDFCPKPCNLYLPPCWPAWYSCGLPEPRISK